MDEDEGEDEDEDEDEDEFPQRAARSGLAGLEIEFRSPRVSRLSMKHVFV